MPGQIVLRVPAGMSEADARALSEAADCRILYELAYSPGYYVLETRATSRAATGRSLPNPPTTDVVNAVAKLRQSPNVLADPNYLIPKAQVTPITGVIPNDPLYPNNGGVSARQQWHMDMIRMPQAWALQPFALQFDNRRVTVAVIDSGIDTGHPDFRHPAIPAQSRILPGRNFFDNPAAPNRNVVDQNGHGTHISGTIAATTNNATGVTGVAGWVHDPARGNLDVRILPIKIFGPPEVPGATLAAVIGAINYAVRQTEGPPVDVINMSFGAPFSFSTLAQAIAEALAANITLVAAAGNEGISGPAFPADYPGVIKVSAVAPNGRRAPYSNFGGPVAIAAPGGFGPPGSNDAILSTWPLAFPPASPDLPRGYNSVIGTSFAAPHVVGAAALLLAAGAPRDPAVIKQLLQSSARAIEGEVPNPQGGNQYGAGLLDVAGALELLLPRVRITSPVNTEITLSKSLSIQMVIRNRRKMGADENLVVDIFRATVPRTKVRETLVGGKDFVVPTETTPGVPVVVTIPVPIAPTPPLLIEQFQIEAKIINQPLPIQSSVFVNAERRLQPKGRSMFSVPFLLVPEQVGLTKEFSLFGGVNFTLARWNNLHTPASGGPLDPYAYFRSRDGARDLMASFDAVLPDGLPLVFDALNATATTRNASIAPVGLGYWLDLDADQILNITGSAVTNPVGIRLFAANTGWNQIGAPFPFPVEWNAVAVQHNGVTYRLSEAVDLNIIEPALVSYSVENGDYVFALAPQGVLEPFQGYWVRVMQDCTLIVPPAGNNLRRSVTRGMPALVAGKGWRVRLQASVAGDRDGQNYFGQVPGAETGKDRADVPKPPSGAGHAYLRFLSDTASGRAAAYAFDMRPTSTNRQEWTVAVTSDRANADVTLTWAGLGGVPRNARLTLIDTVGGKRLPMRSRSGYTFRSSEAGETRLLKITLEPGQSAGPLAITNVGVTSGRSTRGVSVRFQVNQEADVRGLVKTVGGKILARLAGTTRAAATGPATLRWDGRAENGAPVPVGAYVVEITATADGHTTRITRPLLYMR